MQIEHQSDNEKFVARVDGREAVLEYRHLADGRLEYYRTFVPPELRGGGVAGKLVERALEWAEAEGLRVVPSCWYVAGYIERHPRFAHLVAEGN